MIFLQNAEYIKSLLIDFILIKYPKGLIGSEVLFGSKSSFADLLVLNRNKVIAFEIKAAGDDLRNLNKQINLYTCVFDYVYLVVTEKHLIKAKKILNKKIGLICVLQNGELDFIKKAELILSNKKEDLLFSMTKYFLREFFLIKNNFGSYKVKLQLMNKSLAEIKHAFIYYLKNKLTPRNKIFFAEFGEQTHFEDVKLLSFNEDTKLL